MKILFHSFLYCALIFTSCSEEPLLSDTKTNFCDQIHRNDSVTLSDQLNPLEDKMEHQTGVYVLEDGSGSMVSRAWLCEYAEKSIDVQYFIFSTDNVGLIACDYLVRAADRGVKVRILVDDIMVEAGIENLLSFASHENITVKIYNPGVNLGKNVFQKIAKFTTAFRSANQRMHNKTFTIDGKVVITGGRNIADEYFDYDHEYNFRDRDILLIGKETQKVQQSFNQYWDNQLSHNITKFTEEATSAKTDFTQLHEYACNPENFWPQVRERIADLPKTFEKMLNSGELVWLDSINFVADKPGKNDEEYGLAGGGLTTSELAKLIQNAQDSITIQTPYLITTQEVKDLFSSVIQKGVKVRILTNSLASTDNIEAFSSYQSDRNELLEIGIEIYEFRPDAAIRIKIMTGELQEKINHKPIFGLHAKSMVIDGKKSVIGTFNLDPRSANLNTECIVILNSETVSQKILKGMNEEFKPENAWKITLQFNPDAEVSKYKRLKTWTRKVIPKGVL